MKLGANMILRPSGAYFPVRVATLVSNGWTFSTRPGHPDYPGYVSFRFNKVGTSMYLKVHGYIPFYSVGGLCMRKTLCRIIYLAAANHSWLKFQSSLLRWANPPRCVTTCR